MKLLAIILISGIIFSVPSNAKAAAVRVGKECPAQEGIEFICGIQNPEDMVLLHDEDSAIVSSYVKPAGELYLVSTKTRMKRRILSSSTFTYESNRLSFPDCPGRPKSIVPLGLDVIKTEQSRYRLFVANSGEAHRIEVLDLSFRNGLLRKTTWRGCVVAPESLAINGVAALPDGALAVTSTITPTDPSSYGKLLSGKATGTVATWTPQRGWNLLKDTAISGPNGIVASANGKVLFVAGWGDKTLNRIDLANGPTSIIYEKLNFHPDNLRWSSGTELYVAGFEGSTSSIDDCIKKGMCSLTSRAFRINTQTKSLANSLRIAPIGHIFGAATVAVHVDGDTWLGTFHGNRIAIVADTQNQIP